MGKVNRLQKQAFLKENPLCCFCGGEAMSEEPDHVPGRVFFRDRQWPEGYEFPSCVKCNRATRNEEKVVALLARFNSNDENETDFQEFTKMVNDIAKHDREFFSDIRPLGANEIRGFLRKNGISKSDGVSTSDFPLVKFGDVVSKSVRKFGRKLFLALWFKHCGTIFPKSGGMRIAWMTNASHKIDDANLATMLQALSSIPPIIRNSLHLHDQFTYKYAVTTNGDGAGFFVWFRQSFGLICTMSTDRNQLQHGEENIEVAF